VVGSENETKPEKGADTLWQLKKVERKQRRKQPPRQRRRPPRSRPRRDSSNQQVQKTFTGAHPVLRSKGPFKRNDELFNEVRRSFSFTLASFQTMLIIYIFSNDAQLVRDEQCGKLIVLFAG
jgi:hypothetical protein